MQNKITILTDPIPYKEYFIIENIKILARLFLSIFRNNLVLNNHVKYRGHFAVTRSLIEGLQKLNLPFVYNPKYKDITDFVIVLSGVRTLKQAISLKKRGKIKYLFAGPNIVVFSSDHNSIICSDYIDLVIINSQWTLDLYIKDNIILKSKIIIWPAGVNSDFWKPTHFNKSKHILIFDKPHILLSEPIDRYRDYIISKGFTVTIIKYGTFDQVSYLHLLRNTLIMIGFSFSESQGIAWSEAWSTDVPTLIFENHINKINEKVFNCNTAPFLTNDTGLFFKNYNDFTTQFNSIIENKSKFKPRQWVLDNLTDEVSAINLLTKISYFNKL